MSDDVLNKVSGILKKLKLETQEVIIENSFMFIVVKCINDGTFYIDVDLNSNEIEIGAKLSFYSNNGIKISKSKESELKKIVKINKVNIRTINKKNNFQKEFKIYKLVTLDEFNKNDILAIISTIEDASNLVQAESFSNEIIFIDFSMFSEVSNWHAFDPYTILTEKDRKFKGSWDKYIESLSPHDELYDFVLMCHSFEKVNDMSIEYVCDFIIEFSMEDLFLPREILN